MLAPMKGTCNSLVVMTSTFEQFFFSVVYFDLDFFSWGCSQFQFQFSLQFILLSTNKNSQPWFLEKTKT